MASSSSSSSTTTIESSYDVFLNFRGEDTRNTFTGFLHKALKDRGINVFLDSKNLWTGESIGTALHAAIKGSKIWIPIISQGYAESKWCLNELVQIVECWRPSPQQLVLPIFFFVDPSDVRNQKKGSFAKAFQEHKNNFEPHVVNSWRDALKEVGNLKGEVVDDTTVQSEIVESVVQRILGELSSNTKLAESKYLTGIDSPVEDLLSLLDLDHPEVQFVGIWGIGGIGKTTIAKAVYNSIRLKFNKHIFISDVREQATSSMGLVSLQERLLKDTLREKNIDQGKQLIKERLGKAKVLIVLDDVDSAEQIDALAGGTNWFGEGSRVVITTRDEDILSDAKVVKDKIYKPQELNHGQSLRLFSLHAFSSELPPEDYMQLSNDVANYSGGLPLTLEVVGSLLSKQRSIEEWRSTIKYLKEIPPEKVQKRLRISYDKLEGPYLKEVFLDAACFFIGQRKEDVISIWEECGYHPSVTISKLIQRSLIKFEDGHNRRGLHGSILKMHDQIRDMGREIILEENRMDPSQRSRLWSNDETLQILERKQGTITAKSIVLSNDLSDACFYQQHFDMMPNLKFLQICSTSVKENFFRLPSTLKWFQWKCYWKSISTNFYLKGLVHLHLELCSSEIEQAWNISPPDENTRFLKLRVLNLAGSKNLSESPNFSWFPYLEQLDLSWCTKLESLDESIGQLSRLQTLDISFCLRIMELPNSICNLKSLVMLNLSFSGIKVLPNNLDSLSSDVVGIDEVPHSVGLPENLEKLDMVNCEGLEEVPKNSMGRLWHLRTLDMSRTNLSKLPDDFSMLSNLEELSISWNLKSFPIDLSHFNKLRTLKFLYCELLEELPEVSSSLVELKLGICNSLVRTLDISRLSHLKKLQISSCKKLKEIQGLEGAESLENVFVVYCPNLTDRKRNTHGQGTLLLPEMSGDTTPYPWCADSKGLILCVVFKSKGFDKLFKEGQLVPIKLRIEATVRRKDKATKCTHDVRFEDVEYTNQRDVICIHHFKGFDWFGIPLQEKDSVVIQKMNSWYALPHGGLYGGCDFWKLLRGREVHDLQKPIDEWWSPLIVADFFTWYDRPTAAAEEGVPSWLWNDTTMDSEEEEEVQNDTTMDSGPPRQHYNSTTFLEEEDDDNDEDEEEEAEEVPNDTTADSGPGQHHKSTTFLELFCFPFTFLCSPCIPRWGQGSR